MIVVVLLLFRSMSGTNWSIKPILCWKKTLFSPIRFVKGWIPFNVSNINFQTTTAYTFLRKHFETNNPRQIPKIISQSSHLLWWCWWMIPKWFLKTIILSFIMIYGRLAIRRWLQLASISLIKLYLSKYFIQKIDHVCFNFLLSSHRNRCTRRR